MQFFFQVLSNLQACEDLLEAKRVSMVVLEDPIYTPFHLVSLIIFVLAILHTFFAHKFTKIANGIAKRHKVKKENSKHFNPISYENNEKDKSFLAEIFHFLGEVEVIFGIWVIPLLFAIFIFYDWDTAVLYIDDRSYVEPMFVVMIMCIAATKPIVTIAENALHFIARLLGDSIAAWWFAILTIGPLLGSFITEAGAMTLSAMLLARRFYEYGPSKKHAYATLGLLFVNISVGGILTNFAAPPVLIISNCWQWSSSYMLTHFGWKAIIGIVICNLVYFSIFRSAFTKMEKKKKMCKVPSLQKNKVPIWIVLVHIFLLFWLVINEHDPPVCIGSFLLFIGFHQATSPHQFALNLKRPILVGFFLAGLVIHGGLQGWWLIPLFGNLKEGSLMAIGTILTAFNDNAAVTYLSSLVPTVVGNLRNAIMSGVVVGGGLTVIANAPNPAGQMLLRKYFENGVSPLRLFLSALVPTLIFFAIFYFSLILL